ncbi:hypothetical protein B296_00013253, partial [Ensete ventricosum]
TRACPWSNSFWPTVTQYERTAIQKPEGGGRGGRKEKKRKGADKGGGEETAKEEGRLRFKRKVAAKKRIGGGRGGAGVGKIEEKANRVPIVWNPCLVSVNKKYLLFQVDMDINDSDCDDDSTKLQDEESLKPTEPKAVDYVPDKGTLWGILSNFLASNPMVKDQDSVGATESSSMSESKRRFSEKLHAEHESFRTIFNKRRQRIGGFFNMEDD